MTTEKIGYDALYKRALGTARQLAQFLQAFDPQTAGLLRLDTIEPRGTELFDVLPAWYRRVADIVAQVEVRGVGQELLLIHVEVQRTAQPHFGQRMLDYYTLLRRSSGLPVLPYAVLLNPGRPALGYQTYAEHFRGRTIASLTYFQVSLPALDARQYAASGNSLARALAGAMRLPDAEEERQAIYRAAIAAILGALGRAEMDDDAAAALWALVHVYLPYRLERPDEVDVEWSEEDATLVQKLDQKWLADIEARGEATGKIEGKREALRTVLQGRFGALPEAVEHRIAAADGDQLDALLSRAATVARPDEL